MTTAGGLQWSSRFGFIMASVGAAVGLGNIWRFPYLVGENGGGAFVLVYLGAVMLLALPLLMAELYVGRRGAAGPPEAIAKVARESGLSSNWRWMGILFGGVGSILVLSFYSVVGGWTIVYTLKMASGRLEIGDASSAAAIFTAFIDDPVAVLAGFGLFLGATVFISAQGINAGVERATRLMMPALFVMLAGIMVYGAFVGDFAGALRFLFTPDFSKITTGVVLSAFGQAFFSVAVGLSAMMAYGAYVRPDTDIPGTAAIIVAADTLVALVAGLAIFPFIFLYGLEAGAGPGLVFISLPVAFAEIPGGQLIGTAFFLLLFFAALTSSIMALEAPVSWLRDATGLSRVASALTTGAICLVLGILAALSLNELSDVHPLGFIAMFENKTFMDLFEYIVANVMMPVGGILIAVFAGWLVKREFSREELFGGRETIAYRLWLLLLRFVAPVVLAFVLYDVATA